MIIKLILRTLKFVNDIFYENLVHTHRCVAKCLETQLFNFFTLEHNKGPRRGGYIWAIEKCAAGWVMVFEVLNP